VVEDVNLIGIMRGADPAVAGEAVVVGAHYDHEGIGPAMDGDSIYNGADDDASGVVAVLAAALALAAGPPPRRTVIFLLTTGEEQGILGSFHYAANPVVPLERTVADLQVEMVGRPTPGRRTWQALAHRLRAIHHGRTVRGRGSCRARSRPDFASSSGATTSSLPGRGSRGIRCRRSRCTPTITHPRTRSSGSTPPISWRLPRR
jgi:Zn-dependent M28 family amino/carboxypeptidase